MTVSAGSLRRTIDARASLAPAAAARRALATLRRHPRLGIGATLVALLLFVAVFAPLLTPFDPTATEPSQALDPPSAAHWLGTDDLGRDVFARVLYGARVSLFVAVMAVAIGSTLGVSIGLASGYAGGGVDLILMRGIDALLAFPALLLAISITAALGPQIQNAMIAIGIVAVPIYARLTRGQVLSLREREFVIAARSIGTRPLGIALRHILPNMSNTLIVQITLTAAFAILQEAVLSFLGLGAQPPTPSWGQDISYNQGYIANLRWWGSFGPGMAIFVAVFAFNFLGDALRDYLDPRLRRRA